MEFMYLVFTRMPGKSYRGRLRSLFLYLSCVFRTLINSVVRWLWQKVFRLLKPVFSTLKINKCCIDQADTNRSFIEVKGEPNRASVAGLIGSNGMGENVHTAVCHLISRPL